MTKRQRTCYNLVVLAVDSDPTSTLLGLGFYLALIAGLVYHYFRKQKRRTQAAQLTAASVPLPDVVPLHPTIVTPPAKRMPADETPARQEPIDQIRELLGPVPRKFNKEISTYLQTTRPAWMSRRDPMTGVYPAQKKLRREGAVVWGSFVQANQQCFKPGPFDLAGSVIYSLDPYYDAHPGELQAMAHELFALKGTDQADAEASTFARMLSLENSRGMGLPVPRRFTGGRKVLHSAMVFPRKHLPAGFITANIFPIWVDPTGNHNLLLVPAAFWPASLLEHWSRIPEPAPKAPQPKQAEE